MSEQGTNTAQPAWTAAEYEAALAHLEKLQEQIDAMRMTIPAIVAPLTKRTQDRAKLFAEIKTSAVKSVNDVASLRLTWNLEQTQDLIMRSQESLQKDGDLSRAVELPRYGWIEQS